MSTFKQRDNYNWRPNDNSVTTNLRYDLEAEHWAKSFNSAQMNYSSSAGSATLVGLFISLVFHVIALVFILIYDGIKWLLELKKRKRMEKKRKEEMEERKRIAESNARYDKLTKEDIWRRMDELGIEPMSVLHPDFGTPKGTKLRMKY